MIDGWFQDSAQAAEDAVDSGQVVLLAYSGLMMMLTNDHNGLLGAQLMSYGASSRPVAFPRREISSGVQLAHATWDSFDDLALVSCWSAGGGFESHDPSVFVCARHGLRWFAGSSATPGIGSVVALSTVLSIFYLCCCLGRCSPVLCFSWCVPAPTRSVMGSSRRASGRQARSRRLREVRELLAAIPGVAAPLRSAGAGGTDSSEEETRALPEGDSARLVIVAPQDNSAEDSGSEEQAGCSSAQDRDMCSICQEPVSVWVALRPCGHTACRDCTLRLAETSRRCHICRGAIKGVQPVYI